MKLFDPAAHIGELPRLPVNPRVDLIEESAGQIVAEESQLLVVFAQAGGHLIDLPQSRLLRGAAAFSQLLRGDTNPVLARKSVLDPPHPGQHEQRGQERNHFRLQGDPRRASADGRKRQQMAATY